MLDDKSSSAQLNRLTQHADFLQHSLAAEAAAHSHAAGAQRSPAALAKNADAPALPMPVSAAWIFAAASDGLVAVDRFSADAVAGDPSIVV